MPKSLTFDRGTLTFAYDTAKGLLKTITAPGGNALNYTYDGSLPKRETWSGEVNGNVEVTYDNNFRVINQTVNGANAVAFTYDKDGLLKTAGSLRLRRDATNGLLLGDTLGSIVTSMTYNAFGELAAYEAKLGAATLFETGYTRGVLGRISELTETIQGETRVFKYAYDQTGRLTEVRRNDTLISTYTYDPNGNRLSHTTLTGTTTGTYDAQDRLVTYGNVSYTYTANGELLTKVDGTDTTRYAYDAFGNLVRVVVLGGDVIEYIIDGQNRRIGKKLNGAVVKRYVYEGQLRPVAELENAGAVTTRYVYGSKINVPEYVVKGGVTYRVVTDHLGSVRLVVNTSTNAVVQRMDYDEWGSIVNDSNPELMPFGFGGGIYDQQTKLTRFGARDYDPTVGRWTAKDPIGFHGGDWNLYGYVINDPLNFTDKNGQFLGFTGGIGSIFATGVAVGATVNIAASFFTAGKVTPCKLLYAGISGGISGGIGALGGPIGGIGLAGKLIAGLVSAFGGTLGQIVSNQIDPANATNPANAGLFSGLGGFVSAFFPVRGMYSLSQAEYFAPRSFQGLFRTGNARLFLGSLLTASGLGLGSALGPFR